MKGILDKITNWAMKTFFTTHCRHTYKGEKLEYEVVSEIVTDRATIEKAHRVLGLEYVVVKDRREVGVR